MALTSLYIPHICGKKWVTICQKRHGCKLKVKLYFIYLSKLQFTVGSSILLMRTMRCLTPAVLASIACSLVWPPFSKPVSNSPFLPEMTFRKRECHFVQAINLGNYKVKARPQKVCNLFWITKAEGPTIIFYILSKI